MYKENNLDLEERVKLDLRDWRELENKKIFNLNNGYNVFCFIEEDFLYPFAQYYFVEQFLNKKLLPNTVSQSSISYLVNSMDKFENIKGIGFDNNYYDFPVNFITLDMIKNKDKLDKNLDFLFKKDNFFLNKEDSIYYI